MLIRSHGRAVIFLIILSLILLMSCSEDDPVSPLLHNEGNSATIGPDGGELTFAETLFLYVPPGTASAPMDFTLKEQHDVPPPPPGFRQYGPAYSAAPAGITFPDGVAIAIDSDYSILADPDHLYSRPARLSKLDENQQWQNVADGGTRFPFLMSANVPSLGTFAVHVDTTTGMDGEVLADILLSTSYTQLIEGADPVWLTRAWAMFSDPQQDSFFAAGGPVRAGKLTLPFNGYQHQFQHQGRFFMPGESYELIVPSSEEVPELIETAEFFARGPIIISPAHPGMEVSRDDGFTITWDSTGPDLISLGIYGDGDDGFVYFGGATPNDGVLEISAEDLAPFSAGAVINLFLQRTRSRPLTAAGYAAASMIMIETISVSHVIVR